MSDATTVTPPSSATPDLSKYVPKDTVDKLQGDLEKANLQLLDPEYLDFLQAKKLGKATPDQTTASTLLTTLSPQEIESMSKSKLLELAVQRAEEKVTPGIRKEFQAQLNALNTYVGNIGAYIELEQVRKEFSDFDTYKSEIDKIFSTSRVEISYRDAYLQARGLKSIPVSGTTTTATPNPEKPGGVTPPAGDTTKTFKSDHDAAMDAWQQVKTKHGLTGDTI